MPRNPYPFQIPAIEMGLARNMLLADQCGLGKTYSAIHAVRRVNEEFRPLPTLVVCPKPLRYQWKEEIELELPKARVLILDQPMPLAIGNKGNLWLITNYEGLLRLPGLQRIFFGTIIADEGHRIKNKEAQRTRALKALQSHRKIILTGTPLDRNVADLWSLLEWLYPERFRSYWKFYKRYVNHEQDWLHHNHTLPGSSDPAALAELLGEFMLTRQKKDVASDLPPLLKTWIPIEMTTAQKRAYKSLKRSTDWFADVEGLGELEIKNNLSKLTKLLQIASDPRILGSDDEGAKIDWLRQWLEDNPNEKAIVFSRYRSPVSRLAREFEGAVITSKETRLVDEWKAGKVRLLFGTIASCAEGFNFPQASTAICLDQDWSPIKMAQLDERIHRLGIKEGKQMIYLTCKGTADEAIRLSLENSWSARDLIIHLMKEAS